MAPPIDAKLARIREALAPEDAGTNYLNFAERTVEPETIFGERLERLRRSATATTRISSAPTTGSVPEMEEATMTEHGEHRHHGAERPGRSAPRRRRLREPGHARALDHDRGAGREPGAPARHRAAPDARRRRGARAHAPRGRRVLRGDRGPARLEARRQDRRRRAGGDASTIPRGSWHDWWQVGDEPTVGPRHGHARRRLRRT